MRKFNDAIKYAEAAYEMAEGSNYLLQGLVATYELAGRGREMVSMLEAIRRKKPFNPESYDCLYRLYSNESRFEEARRILEEYHVLMPTAVLPYTYIDSLHNNASYDSIFGGMDVAGLWEYEPTEAELGESKYWTILDREQRIVFESGLILQDSHIAYALLDQSSVESMQEYYVGFDSSYPFATLLIARRLRKGQPPLSGQVSGEYVVFQDLKPGDAVEIRSRIWGAGSGDLWRDFWSDYHIFAAFFQRYWEYTIYSNRPDLNYAIIPPAFEPVTGEHCGFNKMTWSGENTAALNVDLALMPPWANVIGKVYVSSVPEWGTIEEWYGSVSEAVLDENPRTEALAQVLVGDATTESAKLDSLYSHIVSEIPYQVIGFDYDYAVPQKPDDVLLNKWGDCKDKSHLLVHMLRDVNMEAWPALVMSRDHGTDLPIPHLGFDHLITCCLVDGDTIFVDPSDLAYPTRYSISSDLAEQPCLLIGCGGQNEVRRLPRLQVDANARRHELTIEPGDEGDFRFTDNSRWYNQQAASRRDVLEGYSRSELKRTLESLYSDAWGVVLALDSASTDPFDSIDPMFRMDMFGSMDLPVQSVGRTTVVSLPNLSALGRTLVPMLAIDNERQWPIDLRNFAGRYETAIHFSAPGDYGSPELPGQVDIGDSLFSFTCETRWDERSRVISIETVLELRDGHTDVESFQPFCKKVLEVFDAPLLFSKD